MTSNIRYMDEKELIERAYGIADVLSNLEHQSYLSRSDKLRKLALEAEADLITKMLEKVKINE